MFRLLTRLSGVAALAFFAVLAFAQNNNGRISETVTDSTGSVIAGAKVTITNASTTVSQGATTNSSGYYVAPDLAVGMFNVTVEARGFKKAEKKGYDLPDRASLTADFKLEVGAMTDSVTV